MGLRLGVGRKETGLDLVISTIANMLILSSMYILAALGLAFLFNMLRILNFSHGAIYMIGGYIGYLFIVGMGFNHWAALFLATLIVAAFGVFLEKFCFRPFTGDFNRTVMVCVAVVVILQTTVNIMVGTKMMAIPTFVEGVLKAGPVFISYERIVTFGIGVVLLGAIIWFVKRTMLGKQMQAIAQHRLGASLQGIKIHRISALAFALGCGLAAVAGCLMGAYLRLSPFMGDLMLVKVLIIVMLAGAGSINGIIIAGLVLGALNAVLPVVISGAASDAVIIAIVVVLMLIRPQGFFGYEVEMLSGDQSETNILSDPTTGKTKFIKSMIAVGAAVIIALLPVWIESIYLLHILIHTFICIIAAVGLRTITISGQFPLAHGAFMGIGAYLAGIASKWLGWPPFLTIPSAALGTMVIGMLIGYPFARLRALYYAMGSLFFGIGVIYIIQAGGSLTGGYSGFTGIRPMFGGSKLAYYYFFLGLAFVSIMALYRFEFSRIGDNLKAIAQSHLVASSVGINEISFRVLAVGMGCFFAGLAGACYAHYNMVLSPASFNFMATLWLVMYVLIGGINSFAGPIVGTIILILIPEFARNLKEYSPYLSAALLLIVAYLMPKGLVSLPGLVISWYSERKIR